MPNSINFDPKSVDLTSRAQSSFVINAIALHVFNEMSVALDINRNTENMTRANAVHGLIHTAVANSIRDLVTAHVALSVSADEAQTSAQ